MWKILLGVDSKVVLSIRVGEARNEY